jgi:hypothetical protein
MLALGVALSFAVSAFIHTTAGFGAGMVAMALLVPLIGLTTAAPLVALVILPLECVIIWRYLEHLNMDALRDMLLALLIGTPIGIWGLKWLDEGVLLPALGTVILVYVAYNVSGKQITLDARRRWPVLFGLSAGILAGAYNSAGPPIVVYFRARGYGPDAFRVNVQMTFAIGTLFVIAGHALSGNVSGDVFGYFVVALPGLVAGFGAGVIAAKRISANTFHWLVLLLLTLLGVNLLLG